MNRFPNSRLAGLLSAAAFLAVTNGASAQTASPAAPMAADHPPMSSSSGGPARPSGVSPDVEQHISRLHGQLGITPAEQAQWEQCAQVMRDNAAQMNQAFMDRSAKVAGMNAVDTMQSYAQLAQIHATNMQKLASAFQALYGSFPDQQKQVADAVFRKNNATRMQHANR